jgi:hypothetical protein
MEGIVNLGILKQAIGTAISCPSCQSILDVVDAALITMSGHNYIACGDCLVRFQALLDDREAVGDTVHIISRRTIEELESV